MYQSNIENFAAYSQFKSLRDLNNNMESFLATHKKDFTSNELVCMKALLRFSAKVKGVSNISINKLLKAISEQFKTISESTFHRFKRKAIKLGILSVIPLSRKNGSQSSNLWVFNRWISNDTPIDKQNVVKPTNEEKRDDTPQNKPKFKTNNNNILNKRNETLDSQFTSDKVNPTFRQFVAYFFNDFKVIEGLWSRLSIAAYKHCFEHDKKLVVEIGINSFKQTVRALKVKKVKDMYGYFYGVCKKKFSDEFFRDSYAKIPCS